VANRVIAIDGPAGSGKSTVARAVADRLGLEYLDTGAMYRGVAFAVLRRGVDPGDVPAVADVARSVALEVTRSACIVDGEDASVAIRGAEVTTAVTAVAANPEVRAEMVARQRAWVAEHGGGVMEGRDLEIAWVDDPVELFFLQIQGSGRVRLPDGSHLRVGYGGANGHPYSSIGKELIRRGTMTEHEVSAQGIKSWVRGNPFDGEELLFHNDSYVFFREVNEVPPERGPLGAMNRSITAMRSIAVDPAFTPLGAPVWIEKDGAEPMRRLMIAQDTGSAIKGAQRADIFFGTGAEAGSEAGKIKDAGRLVVLLPIQRAYALLPESVL